MKLPTVVAAVLLTVQALAASPPTPPPQLCVDDSCASTSRSSGYEFPDIATTPSDAPLKAVSTFHNVGLYWKEGSGSGENEALVRFRKSGTSEWRQGLSLWFDNRSSSKIPYGSEEYRGSLVELESNSTYDVEVLAVKSGRLASTQVRTWNESFPIGSTVTLPAMSNSTLNITQSGTPNGYRLYTFAPGSSATIDGKNTLDNGVVISGSYVILRGLNIKRVRNIGVVLSQSAHHVVIEQNDISEFGRPDPDEPRFACNNTGGIMTASLGTNFGMTNLVIQNNRIHHPNFDSNSWEEFRTPNVPCGPSGDGLHPAGAAAIYLKDTGGNHVIRYNEIYSDFDHMFDDGLSGGSNFSFNGDLRRDSDVYGNRASHIWDDALQSEGAGMNIRMYKNFTENVKVSIANAPVSIGPMYVFRNVATKGVHSSTKMNGEGWFWKTRNKSTNGSVDGINIGGGRIYLFHNTAYRTGSGDAIKSVLNVDDISLVNIVALNNIWNSNQPPGSAKFPMPYAQFDYDLYTAGQKVWNQEQPHGRDSNPAYDSQNASGKFTLAAGAPGQDDGILIPNFNCQFSGSAPDVGAQERGWPALKFGVRQ